MSLWNHYASTSCYAAVLNNVRVPEVELIEVNLTVGLDDAFILCEHE